MFLQVLTYHGIAQKLTDDGIKTPGGKDKWSISTVKSILSNEKYKGDAMLQKCFTVDYLTKKQKKNEGEIPQYYVEGNHEVCFYAIFSTSLSAGSSSPFKAPPENLVKEFLPIFLSAFGEYFSGLNKKRILFPGCGSSFHIPAKENPVS